METRPTTDRVKEGLFNILQFDIEGRRVLDLFAGTGQLGIECLSPGRGLRGVRGPAAGRRQADPGESEDHEPAGRSPGGGGGLHGVPQVPAGEVRPIFLDPPYEAGLLEPGPGPHCQI